MPTQKKPSKKSPQIQTAPEAIAAESEPFDPVIASNVIRKIKAQYPAIDNARRKAYRSRSSDADADKAGTQTNSAAVRQGASGWAVTIHETLQKGLEGLTYPAARFVWFIECFEALHKEIAAEADRRSKAGKVRTAEASAFDSAVATRAALYSACLTFAKGRSPEGDALNEIALKTDSTESVTTSTLALVALAESWLALEDETSLILAEDANLTTEKIDAARDAVEALSSNAADTSLEGKRTPRDTPAINRAEGRMLFEMKEARRLFEEANEKNHLVPKLIPLVSIAHAFGRRPSNGKGAEEPATEQGEAAPAPV